MSNEIDAKEIWEEDAFGRREQAESIVRYLERRSQSRKKSGISQGFVLAIDGEYGQGKSYLVRNMQQQIGSRYPTCLIDAWADDRIESPFLAILDGVETAFAPFIDEDQPLRTKLANLMGNAVPLTKGIASGVFKKGVTVLAGEGAETAIENAWNSDELAEDIGDAVESGLEDGLERISGLADSTTKEGLKAYRENKLSMVRLRNRLASLAARVESDTEACLPVFIFIDELDRCRPSYAISLLEEIKHLFDVPGFVFVLSINKSQLEQSISAVYGEKFDARNYLDRFFDKTYRLTNPALREFAKIELERASLTSDDFLDEGIGVDPLTLIGIAMDQRGLTLRETERAVDMIRASADLLAPFRVSAVYLTNLIIGQVCHRQSKPRDRFEAIELKWRDPPISDSLRVTTERMSSITNFSDLVGARGNYAAYNHKRLLRDQGKQHGKVEQSNSIELLRRFFDQFDPPISEGVTMKLMCEAAINDVRVFEEPLDR